MASKRIIVQIVDAYGRKQFLCYVVAQEKHVESHTVSANHSITFSLREFFHSGKRYRSEILLGTGLIPTTECGVVGNSQAL
ncbi:MAG: hypothetical protein ACK55Z_29035, partial [bacterium]